MVNPALSDVCQPEGPCAEAARPIGRAWHWFPTSSGEAPMGSHGLPSTPPHLGPARKAAAAPGPLGQRGRRPPAGRARAATPGPERRAAASQGRHPGRWQRRRYRWPCCFKGCLRSWGEGVATQRPCGAKTGPKVGQHSHTRWRM